MLFSPYWQDLVEDHSKITWVGNWYISTGATLSYDFNFCFPSSNELNASYAADGYARVMHGSGGAAKHGCVGAILTTYVFAFLPM